MADVPAPKGYPTRIKVGCYPITIRYFDGAEEDERKNYAYFCPNLWEIGISVRLHPVKMWEAFWHEVKHGVWLFMDAPDKIGQEKFCEMSGKGETLFFVDNPHIHQWQGLLLYNTSLHKSWTPDPALLKDRSATPDPG